MLVHVVTTVEYHVFLHHVHLSVVTNVQINVLHVSMAAVGNAGPARTPAVLDVNQHVV